MTQIFLSLQPSPVVDPEKSSLQYLIKSINERKGSFRNVTEESLEQEIKNQSENEAIELDGESETQDQVEEEEDEKTKRDKIYKARGEMLKQLGDAQQQSQMALDLVSLLVAQQKPGPASLTMSPIIKQTLPTGSINAEVVKKPEESEAKAQQDEMTHMGWKMQSLNKAADSLHASASRLEKEVEKETAYWDQVLAVKQKGWSLSRLPREKHTLGVHYGLAEAHSSFRDRGTAALRLTQDGSLALDRGLRSSDQRLRLRLLRGREAVATLSSPSSQSDEQSIEQEILDARNSLYDEELFLEIGREAQYLLNQGVTSSEDSVTLPYEKGFRIEISLQTPGDMDSQTSAEAGDNSQVLSTIMLLLRLLLSQAHSRSYRERSKPPPALREGPRPRPIYPILKPIVETLKYDTRPELLLANLLQGLRSASHTMGGSKVSRKP